MSAIRNIPDWPRFLVLKASVFLLWIHFLDLAVFGLYNFFVLAFFHLDSPPRLSDYLTLNFYLLGLLLRLFLA